MAITIQQMHDICTQMIDAVLGDMPIVDIENRTRTTDYVIADIGYNEDIKAVTIEFDKVNRGSEND